MRQPRTDEYNHLCRLLRSDVRAPVCSCWMNLGRSRSWTVVCRLLPPMTGQSKGFCFIAYEDQRSTVLAVDNLSGAKVAGRIIRVEHVLDYKMKRKEARAVRIVKAEAQFAAHRRRSRVRRHCRGSE